MRWGAAIGRLGLAWLCLWVFLAATSPPKELDRLAGYDQRLGASLPMELAVIDAQGRTVPLRAVLHGRPAILALGYFDCPNLCDTVLQNLAHGIAASGDRPGQDMQVIFASVDPHDDPEAARHAMRQWALRTPDANVSRWAFLTGEGVSQLAAAVGFRYFYEARLGQYVHPAGLVVVTPQGRIAQYMMGVDYPPRTLHLALVEASRGQLGSLTDRLVLLCCGYDPSTGRYSLLIGKTMRVAGMAFLALLLGVLAWLLRSRRT
ncbi:MAG TPA: SCO family protein [Dyella sp.]|uniref:SCO family protein n=1 Tax=Dyella sp. TaxID=1869338 RepID=UPI002F920CBE